MIIVQELSLCTLIIIVICDNNVTTIHKTSVVPTANKRY